VVVEERRRRLPGPRRTGKKGEEMMEGVENEEEWPQLKSP